MPVKLKFISETFGFTRFNKSSASFLGTSFKKEEWRQFPLEKGVPEGWGIFYWLLRGNHIELNLRDFLNGLERTLLI
jgi:hypothetical protein